MFTSYFFDNNLMFIYNDFFHNTSSSTITVTPSLSAVYTNFTSVNNVMISYQNFQTSSQFSTTNILFVYQYWNGNYVIPVFSDSQAIQSKTVSFTLGCYSSSYNSFNLDLFSFEDMNPVNYPVNP